MLDLLAGGPVEPRYVERAADLAAETARRWQQEDPSPEVKWVVRHALRGLVKQGHKGALALQGVQAPRVAVERFGLSPKRLR
ncbi:MAG: DNA alkylation repair protein, partial [Nitrospinae bacterium]|nr:DNA alkylation repair protein [Nitrospinota bacterium]